MSDADAALLEEFEVLESIYPEELSKLSDRDIEIEVEPDDVLDGEDPPKLNLKVHYPEGYPDVLPELSLEPVEGEFNDEELASLITDMHTSGEENLGMAMTFTLVTLLKEKLAELVISRIERRKHEENEKERRELEAEEERTRGTPVTLDSFSIWKTKFDRDVAERKAREDDERLKGLTAKEKEEFRRMGTRLSGRQLFERDKSLATADDALAEEGTVSVDISQYERVHEEEEEETERATFSDSD